LLLGREELMLIGLLVVHHTTLYVHPLLKLLLVELVIRV
jgi:hypothetical protein